MLFANYLPQLSLSVMSAVLCLASTQATAATPKKAGASKYASQAGTDKALALKLDLGLAVGGEDCEGDYADLMQAATGSSATPAVEPVRMTAAVNSEALAIGQLEPAPEPAPSIAAPAAAVAAPPGLRVPSWEVIPSDKTLHTALARWSAIAGWQLVWELPVDYAVSVRTEIRGTFAEAVAMVTKSMATAEIPMKAIFYDGNRVLRIVAKGSE
jgi:hypothetical protein